MDTEPATSPSKVVSCDLVLEVSEPAEVVLQVAASTSAGAVRTEHLALELDEKPVAVDEIAGPHGTRLHRVRCLPGRLRASYRAEIAGRKGGATPPGALGPGEGDGSFAFESVLYTRPSRYCPSDHLFGFAAKEFPSSSPVPDQVQRITEWIRRRVEYVPGSSTVHDSAEDTLLMGVGTCRDFAHLAVALCRAVNIPARFLAVYAPGLSPMDFHAVFESLEEGRWCVHDATGLAPRASLVRIGTGRDAADSAFATTSGGRVDLLSLTVTATVEGILPIDHPEEIVELA